MARMECPTSLMWVEFLSRMSLNYHTYCDNLSNSLHRILRQMIDYYAAGATYRVYVYKPRCNNYILGVVVQEA